jgi:hypothetical protein
VRSSVKEQTPSYSLRSADPNPPVDIIVAKGR